MLSRKYIVDTGEDQFPLKVEGKTYRDVHRRFTNYKRDLFKAGLRAEFILLTG